MICVLVFHSKVQLLNENGNLVSSLGGGGALFCHLNILVRTGVHDFYLTRCFRTCRIFQI